MHCSSVQEFFLFFSKACLLTHFCRAGEQHVAQSNAMDTNQTRLNETARYACWLICFLDSPYLSSYISLIFFSLASSSDDDVARVPHILIYRAAKLG
ncbi:hypothetical protein DE146DRAFT_640555 [Phaeosphaeria sp. MPI-PUGE-AT-0046c]|nr:hypothetical protein DE146DRAFT_640555 [Phaeosphaeria sp. MPI-PUGE-AT-0046c]